MFPSSPVARQAVAAPSAPYGLDHFSYLRAQLLYQETRRLIGLQWEDSDVKR